jgi:hypothetical protein
MLSGHSLNSRRLTLLVPTLILLLVGMISGNSQAQMGMWGDASSNAQSITRRGLDAYSKLLNLDKDQRDVAISLFEGHQTAVRRNTTEFEEKIQALQEKMRDGDFAGFQREMPAITKDFAKRSEDLEKGFFNDLKAILDDNQLGKWEVVERYRRREVGMRFGFMSGAAVDLIAVVERLRIEKAQETSELLAQYELQVDRKLVDFERMAKEAQNDMGGEGMFDFNRVQETLKKFGDLAREVRDMNRDYARRITPTLPAESRQAFDDEIMRRSFPRVYRPAHAMKMLDVAMKLPDLNDDQRHELEAVRSSYQRDLAIANERWARAIEAAEEASGGSMQVMMRGFMGGGQQEGKDDLGEARDARRDLDRRTEKRVSDMLNTEQRAQLPKKEREDFNPMADFMPVNDEDE